MPDDNHAELVNHGFYASNECENVSKSSGGHIGGKTKNGFNITTICVNELTNEQKQIELIVAQKRALKPSVCSPPKRFLFVLLGFMGTVMLYALRVNLSVAIVSMVKSNSSVAIIDYPLLLPFGNDTADANTTASPVKGNGEGEFDWDENTQGLILGSFFWGYVIFQLPGGRMADTFGGKWLLFSGIFVTALLTIISPLAARLHYMLFIACRILEGVFEGCFVPSMHSMIAKWFPPNERSSVVGIIYSGSMIGTVVTMPLAAILCDSDVLGGWPSVFYLFGLAGIVWSLLWAFFIYESPESHPGISQKELRMILTSQNHDSSKKKPNIPWLSLLASIPLWALATAHFGQNWGFYTMLTQMPRYFKNVLGFDLKSNGLYSALPYLSQALVASSMGFVCDHLYRTDRFGLSTLRKSFNTIAFAGTGICLFLVTRIGRDRLWNILLLIMALGINGMSMAGFSATHVDMSPNFAGTLMGITNCIANFAGVFSPLVVGQILSFVTGDEPGVDFEEKTLLAWNYIFYLSALIYLFTGTVFVLFGSNVLQKWNDPPTKIKQSHSSKYIKKTDE